MTVVQYCAEEVDRQGHNTQTLDGIARVGGMLIAWAYALENYEDRKPTIEDAIAIAQFIEPERNAKGIRTCHVIVGEKTPPRYEFICQMMEALWQRRENLTPLRFYMEFELIHPFADGNGRTGKILLNWLDDSLLCPWFPPNDLFGKWIRNP